MGTNRTAFSASPLAWKWILEKLLDNKNLGTPLLKGLTGYVRDIEEPQCGPLIQRIALRYLEEAVANRRIDMSVIPLVEAASEIHQGLDKPKALAQSVRDKKLLLRVKIEAAISCIRRGGTGEGEGPDWDAFAETLREVFPPDEANPYDASSSQELRLALATKDEKAVAKYPLERLRKDLLYFIKQKKAMLEKPALAKMADDYFEEDVQPMKSADETYIVGEVPLSRKRISKAHLSDFVIHAQALLGMDVSNSRPSSNRQPQKIIDSNGSRVMPKDRCLESKEDGAQIETGTQQCEEVGMGRLSVQSDAATEIVHFSKKQDTGQNVLKRRRDSVNSDDSTQVVGVASPCDKDARARMNAASNAHPPKLRKMAKCYQCSMGGSLLHCDSCKASYHLECVGSMLTGEWKCPDCGILWTVPTSKLLPIPPPICILRPDSSQLESTAAREVSDDEALVLGGKDAAIFAKAPGVNGNQGVAIQPADDITKEGSDVQNVLVCEKHVSSKDVAASSEGHQNNLLEEATTLPTGKRGWLSDGDDKDVEILESLSCKRPKSFNLICLDDEPVESALPVNRNTLAAAEEPISNSGLSGAQHKQVSADGKVTKGGRLGTDERSHMKSALFEPTVSAGMIPGSPSNRSPQECLQSDSPIGNASTDKRNAEGRASEEEVEDDETLLLEQNLLEPRKLEYFSCGQDGQEELCHVCGNGGILVCCDGCPIAIHYSCLKSKTEQETVDDNGNWYCPFCARNKAVQAVLHAREAVRVAQKQLLDAKKVLAALQDGLPRRQEVDRGHEHRGNNRVQLNESSVDKVAVHQSDVEATMEATAEIPHASLAEGAKRNDLGPTTSCKSSHEQEHKETRGLTEVGGADSEGDGGRVGSPQGGVVALRHDRADVASPPQNAASKPDSPKGEVEGERHDGDVEQTSRPPKPTKRMLSGRNAAPGIRRKALPWTQEEEQMLKEGVKRYSHDGTWGFQWQRILEFGFGTFDESRTGVDLKDKWRNMQKRASPRTQ